MNTQTMIQGDCLPFMKAMPDASFDAVITDPPYASGGLTTADRKASPVRKYISRDRHPSFDSDTRDQRSHFMWSVMWMAEALRLTREGGWLMVCSDWRQLPTTSDALQVAGWTWRSIVVWDKTEAARPHQGMFRNQVEFVLVATRGSIGKEQDRPRVFPAGVFRHYLKPADKHHLTGKPVPLMAHLMTVLPAQSRILDPFAGSGSTLAAAQNLGHAATGIELSPEYYRIACNRLGLALAS
ncbi:site-specific DNA-methyltransferase [Akkermansia sp.]|uniref:DNA-methyltransferase n=1 Tax=Akkermansia sp. TaxID=1872421 RepID=UPI0025BCE250|nr:site-specific DNA-methyltransferase [Akkermansia sp.]